MKNKYIKGTHISEQKFREILRHFSLDIESEKTAILVGISRSTLTNFTDFFVKE